MILGKTRSSLPFFQIVLNNKMNINTHRYYFKLPNGRNCQKIEIKLTDTNNFIYVCEG